jgi:hypothetical protein
MLFFLQVADEHNLELSEQFGAAKAVSAGQREKEDTELAERLRALRAQN